MLKVRLQATASLDAKGRLALPAALRRALGEAGVDGLVLTFHKGAVWGFTPAMFEERVERPLENQDPFAEDVMHWAHALLAPAQDVEVDGQGRIRIPQTLRDLARLDKEVMVNSLSSRIEIWDRAAWDENFRRSLDRVAESRGMPGGS